MILQFRTSKHCKSIQGYAGCPSGSAVKNLPAMQEIPVGSLGQEDPLDKGMATHSSILAWRIPWTEEPDELQSMGSQSWTRLKRLGILAHRRGCVREAWSYHQGEKVYETG